jgi:DNA (cytosine-5)-methyltransferase 1
MSKLQRPSVLDLFAGAGGFSLGLHWAGWRTAVAIDHDPVTVETLQANFSHLGTVALLRDLGKLTPKKLDADLAQLNIERQFDAIVGGPPCQGWSNVGRGKLRSLKTKSRRDVHGDPRNNLYENFLRTIDHFRPKVAVMENVPGMLSHNGTNVAELIAEWMEGIDYTTTWAVLNAMDYGVPQVRHRLFFVGVRKDLNVEFHFPKWSTPDGERIYPLTTVRDAIADLPPLQNGGRQWILPYTEKRSISGYGKLMRKLSDRNTVFDHVCRKQNDDDLEAFRLMKQGGLYRDLPARLKRYREDIFDDKYKKLYWDRQSWCVTAHLSKDCYTHIHPSQARTISVREAARLQSFPDSFYFGGSMGNKFQMIGNAVPPLLAQRIGAAVLEQVLPTPLASLRSSVA